MDFGEVIPTSDNEEEELEFLDDEPSLGQTVISDNAGSFHPLPPEPHTPSKRPLSHAGTPRKRRKVDSSSHSSFVTTPLSSIPVNGLNSSEGDNEGNHSLDNQPIVMEKSQPLKHPLIVTERLNPAEPYFLHESFRLASSELERSHTLTALDDVSSLSTGVVSPPKSAAQQDTLSLQAASPLLDTLGLPSSSPDDPRLSTPSSEELFAPHVADIELDSGLSSQHNRPATPNNPDVGRDTSITFPSTDPLDLLMSQITNGNRHLSLSRITTPSPPPDGAQPRSPSGSPIRSRLITPSPPPIAGPSRQRQSTPESSPLSSPQPMTHSPPPEIPPDVIQPRRQLRPRTAAQTRPYTVDMVRYRHQVKHIPGAYEPMPELHRRRKSPIPGTFDERGETSDPDVTPMDFDEELSEGEQRRRRRKSGSPDVDVRHQRQRPRTTDTIHHGGDPGPSRRILKSPQKQKSPPRRHPPVAYPAALQSLSSSDSDDDLIVLARPIAKSKPSGEDPEPPKRKRPKPFPMKQKPPIEKPPPRPQKDPTPPSSPLIAASPQHQSVASDRSPSPLPLSLAKRPSPFRFSPMYDNAPDNNPYDEHNFVGDDAALPSEFDIPPSSSHVSSNGHHDLTDEPLDISDGPNARSDSIIDLADSDDSPQLLSDKDDSSENSGSTTDSESARVERKRLKILKRMMPGRWIREQQKKEEQKRRNLDRPDSLDRDQNNDEPLQPGQSRVRKATQIRSNLEIRGDSESSDIEIPQPYPDILRSPSQSRSPSPLLSQESGSESDVGGFARGRHYTINLISSESEQGDDESISHSYEAELDDVPTGPSHSRRWYLGEAREENLIDRMLSRSHTAGAKNPKPKRHRTKAHRSSTAQPRLSKNALDVTVGGAKRRTRPHQTKLPFSRHSSSRRSIRIPQEDLYPSGDADVLEISDNEEGSTVRHKLNPITAADVLKRKAKEKEAEKRKGKVVGPGVFVLGSRTQYLTTGRSHQPYTIAAEEEAVSRTTIPFPDRHGPSKKKKKRKHKPLAKGTEMPLDLIWQRITDPKASSPGPSVHERAEHRAESGGTLQKVQLDCSIQLLPSGVSFGRSTYLGKGRLRDLLVPPDPTDDTVRPNPCVVFDLHITSYSPAHDFRGLLENLVSKLVTYISGPTRSVPREEYHEWQKAFSTASQHVTWFLVHSDAEDVASLRLEVDEHLRRISAVVEEHHAVRSDVSILNLLVLESQWFALELAWRTKGFGEGPVSDNPASALHHSRSLLRHLFAIGLERPMMTISPLGVDDSKDVYRIAELWICMIHMTEHWKPSSTPVRRIPSFWDMLLDIAKSMELHRFSSYNTAISELLWTTIFQLCSLSQFTILGMTTATPTLASSWSFVAFTLEHIRLEPNEAVKPSTRRKGESYIRMLVSRCMLLNKRWHWGLDDASVLFNRLLTIFKSRKFSNLLDEKSDFPSFLHQNKLEFLSEHRSSDSAFTLFLKLVVQAAIQADAVVTNAQKRPLPVGVKKVLQLVVPVGAVPFTKTSPPTERELSMLYNRFSAVAIAIYLEPTPANTKYWMTNARRYANFANADDKTRVTCIRGFMQLSILLRHLKLPLEHALGWLAEMTSVLIDEYRSYHKPSNDNVDYTTKSAREATILHVGLVLGAVRRIIETPVMESNVQSKPYPDPALIDGPWIARIFSIETDLTSISKIRNEVRRLVQEFLKARIFVIPKPARPRRPMIAHEESQESQEDYNQFDLDLDDPELWAALDGSNITPLTDDLVSKERRVTELIDTHISPAIYRLVCKHFIEIGSSRISPFASNDTDIWIDCWVGCASVLVQNGKRDWSLYFDLGPQSWERISDAPLRRRVGLRFMLKVLELDPAAYKNHQDRFLEVLMESLASARPTIEHQYASLLFSIDGLTHQFLQGIEAGEVDEAGDFSLSKETFVEYRMSWIENILNGLSGALAKEGSNWTHKATNQIWLGFLLNMLSSMHDVLESLPPESEDHAAYISFCKLVVQTVARYPLIWDHHRIRSSTHSSWLQSQL